MAPESGMPKITHQQRNVNLFALAGRNAPKLDALQDLPTGMHLIGVGRPSDEGIWPYLTNLKWIHSVASGVERLLIPEMARDSVIVTNSRGPYSHALAEWAITACSWFAKDLPRLKAQQKDRNWEPYYVEELRGKHIGIVGYGDIGQAVGNLAQAFKMNVIALRRRTQLSQHERDQALTVYGPEQLNKLMAESDYIVNALPLTEATLEVIDARAIASMKHNAVFVNVGRGKTIDETALVQALQNKHIRGAALDVTYTEPLSENSPLWDLDNVLISPHTAARTELSFSKSTKLFGELAQLYVEGKELFNVVDPEEGY
ncbi:MAG: D-isomer specific 2-hydroxyacid dehydrogenase [Trebouxia sp. A1-2]|nr:MAG: D-isomer specific 2-hydroxyacid dehydrogenase [Trebouxia sp. A1-2]